MCDIAKTHPQYKHFMNYTGPDTSKLKLAPTQGTLKPTGKDIEGPFYRPNPPESNLLCDESQPGDKLVLCGQVTDTFGKPIPGARVDLWQADKDGNYDVSDPADDNNPNIPYKFRGWQSADAGGNFEARTIRPGHYQIGENQWRTGHMHVKVSAPGFRPLTTQLYFEHDEHNVTNNWFSPDRVVAETPLPGGWTSARFNLVLPRLA